MMRIINVGLADRSYPIYIGKNLLSNNGVFTPHIISNQIAIISNKTIAKLFLSTLIKTLKNYEITKIIIPDGEQYKHWNTLYTIFDQLLTNRHNRRTTLIALGGGVIGDITGFAASCYQRGVNFIQVPTTLLAQVDSSIGGKTGINHRLGKNMIGSFYQPKAVIIDTMSLLTLSVRQLSAGTAEIIKYGLIRDESFFYWVENNIKNILSLQFSIINEAIEQSCLLKSNIIMVDEFESGIRTILNLGHTFGHAIEQNTGYGVYLHGEAIAMGIVMALEMSYQLDYLTKEQRNRVILLLFKAKLPIIPPQNIITQISFLSQLMLDKKMINKIPIFVLLKGIGKAVITSKCPINILKSILYTDYKYLVKEIL